MAESSPKTVLMCEVVCWFRDNGIAKFRGGGTYIELGLTGKTVNCKTGKTYIVSVQEKEGDCLV